MRKRSSRHMPAAILMALVATGCSSAKTPGAATHPPVTGEVTPTTTRAEAGSVALSSHWDLCTIFSLDRARQIEPRVTGQNADDIAANHGGRFSYWCSWNDKPVPASVAAEVAHADRNIIAVQISESDFRPGEDHSHDEVVKGVGSEAFWWYGDGQVAGALGVIVRSRDAKLWTSFFLEGGVDQCDEDGACLEVPHSGDRLKPKMIVVARAIVRDIEAKLDTL